MKSSGMIPADNLSAPDKGIFQSDTGEITIYQQEKLLKLITPLTEAVATAGSDNIKLGTVQSVKTSIPACVALTSMDSKPLTESKHMVLIYSTENANSGMVLSHDRKKMLKKGQLPVLLRTGNLKCELRNRNARKLKLYVLGFDGSRREELPLREKNGVLDIAIDTSKLKHGPSVFYELASEQIIIKGKNQQMCYKLDNGQLCFSVDEYGKPFELYNRNGGDNYIKGHDLWRLIVSNGDCMEEEVIPDNSPADINIIGNKMTIMHSHVQRRFSHKQLDITVIISVSLNDDELDFKVELSNNQQYVNVKEIHFPLLAIRDETLEGIITTYTGGQYFSDVRSKIMKGHTQFKGIDHHYIRDVNCYPVNAMNCMLADRGHEGLYFGCHDPSSSMTAHILELEDGDNFNMTMARFPYIREGEKYCFEGFILSAYKGTWHNAADKYREWAQSWYKVPDRPEFIRKSNGWQRIIMRTQYGRVLFPYETRPYCVRMIIRCQPFDLRMNSGRSGTLYHD
eukprot:TRINITY_DN6239_c0_g3_i1.p2 TRINITY_DN6239_c0_g3~~TRINITY_DN6239_c0_g3_i1.p2  ORF type:complete len:511 (-),score=65.94 TRINITY_DN6239_c0_g3_i1:1334-2866(-)